VEATYCIYIMVLLSQEYYCFMNTWLTDISKPNSALLTMEILLVMIISSIICHPQWHSRALIFPLKRHRVCWNERHKVVFLWSVIGLLFVLWTVNGVLYSSWFVNCPPLWFVIGMLFFQWIDCNVQIQALRVSFKKGAHKLL
jgi:hypothetical protein